MAENFVAITGASMQEARMYLEMAGGDLDTAIAIFFDGGGAAPIAIQEQGWVKPDWYSLVWPGKNPIPDKWLEQGFEFSSAQVRIFSLGL